MDNKNDSGRSIIFTPLFFGGISGACVLGLVILLDEGILVLCGGDLGAFLWTTFHFIFNPIFCLIYVILTVIKILRTEETRYRAIYSILILLAIAYIYIYF
jgi:hypothetical protein